jgi:hypothetical protein
MNRNNVIYPWQKNRNPFIDNPDLVEYIWGNKVGETYTLSSALEELNRIMVYPNPSRGFLNLRNITTPTEIKIYDTLGRLAFKQSTAQDIRIDLNLGSGIYLLQLKSSRGSLIKKMVVE